MNSQNYKEILEYISSFDARLIVVSKYRSFEEIEMVKNWGQKIFAENRVQELISKKELHGTDLSWHIIGTLQKNKVKFILPWIDLIHSVDSLSLLKEIDKQAVKNGIIQDCLLQIKIAEEETKQGLVINDVHLLLTSDEFKQLNNIRINGIMGMATNTEDHLKIRSEFKQLRHLFDELKRNYFYQSNTFKEISAGMSDDYKIALDEGSTFIRIGSMIFNP